MSFLQKIRSGLSRLMYGRNGMDRMSLALVWGCVALSLLGMLLTRWLPQAQRVMYYLSLAVWAWALFRVFSKNVYKRREENSRYLQLTYRARQRIGGIRARHADKTHKYFSCKSCKTVCRVPVGKGKVIITCPKCGAQIHAKT